MAVTDERFGDVIYGELAIKVGRLAAAMQASGIRRGDRFIVALPNWYQVSAFALALNYIGAIAVHMPFMGGAHEYAGVINAAQAKGIAVTGKFRSANYVSVIDSIAQECNSLELRISVGCDRENQGWITFDNLLGKAPADKPEPVAPYRLRNFRCCCLLPVPPAIRKALCTATPPSAHSTRRWLPFTIWVPMMLSSWLHH